MQRVGLLVPSVNTVVEPEFWRLDAWHRHCAFGADAELDV